MATPYDIAQFRTGPFGRPLPPRVDEAVLAEEWRLGRDAAVVRLDKYVRTLKGLISDAQFGADVRSGYILSVLALLEREP
jgi:hypothetical protein